METTSVERNSVFRLPFSVFRGFFRSVFRLPSSVRQNFFRLPSSVFRKARKNSNIRKNKIFQDFSNFLSKFPKFLRRIRLTANLMLKFDSNVMSNSKFPSLYPRFSVFRLPFSVFRGFSSSVFRLPSSVWKIFFRLPVSVFRQIKISSVSVFRLP
ncbi:hypothetical protein B9Z55_013395 [Caenorhabditis nigoni]|uniref:Uncharacterized protein n=1 Tax=Caenorhabditis nigoni TaxID=1611254 RepID=A0A2G5U1I2_9PELO|nr:hypothetical protein B9Z55_013395 [Caenorhabditis nigoni]